MKIYCGGVVPVLDAFGEPVCLLRRTPSTLFVYDYDNFNQPPDTRVFSLYDTVVLTGVTECAFILLKDALADYPGRVICAGTGWDVFRRLFPERTGVEYFRDIKNLPEEVRDGRTMYLKEFVSSAKGSRERCDAGLFSYDEIMTIVYCFAIRKSYGTKHPDKRFLLVNPFFEIEGLMSVCDKVEQFYKYGEANGFIPVLRLTHSDQTQYSDAAGEDIWEKFFDQPSGSDAEEWREARNVWEMPLGHATWPQRWLMERIAGHGLADGQFMNTKFLNKRVKAEIRQVRNRVLPHPERTIGVLIRGTDYTISHIPGHSRMAAPEQVMEKIREWEASGKYDEIFLSTEDADILEKMKALCGDRLRYIDQRRFRIRPGEILPSLNGGGAGRFQMSEKLAIDNWNR